MAKKPTQPSFYDVVTAAVADLTEYGYDSQARVDDWMERLRVAAASAMLPEHKMDELLRDTMRAIYKRLIENGGALRWHGGVSAFTLQQIKPRLHDELQRRIMTSASLIKLNREQSIAKTMQRFQGWASSVPAGGSKVQDKPEIKYDIKKSLKQLPFEERRVIIDQGHKLTASINDVIAQDGGAIAMRWHSHWREANYNFRQDHKERDGLVYLIPGSWAHKKGLVKPGPAGSLDKITQPAEEPFCFPGDTSVPFADGVEAAYRRWYSGPVATIRTASGRVLTGTPNHPILTVRGWVAIGAVQKGDQVIEMADQVGQMSEHHQHGAQPSIADAFAAIEQVGAPQKRSGQMQQFHGDGSEGDVDIVVPHRPLAFGFDADAAEGLHQFRLAVPDGGGAPLSALDLRRGVLLAASDGGMSGMHEPLSPVFALPRHAEPVGVGPVAQGNALCLDRLCDRPTADAEALCDRQDAFAALVGAGNGAGVDAGHDASLGRSGHALGTHAGAEGEDVHAERTGDLLVCLPFAAQTASVVHVNRHEWSGHVFNLQTASGLYVAGGIVAHNCRCFGSYIYSPRKLPDDMVTAKGREAMADARAKAQAA